MVRRGALAALFVVLVGCGQAELSGVGGGQILEFDNDLRQQVTVLYCPQQGCAQPISHRVAPGKSWRTANETINDSGAVALRVAGRIKGCRLIPAVGVLVDPLLVLQASYILGNPGCVRPG